MDIKEIKQIVDLMKRSDLTEFAVEEENFKLQIKRATETQAQPQIVSYAAPAPAAPAPAAPAAPATPAPAAPTAPAADDNATYVTSPMVGTFYSAPSPDSPAFAKVGDSVKEDSVVCIIEAMKIMNEIQAEVSGKIAEVLVENGQPVEFGQKLFRLA
ncbi:acetyl-CoA carboxylase biotin carboxyl carrier protein [Pelagicoccus mobilis]|uniref:Biotin carboxyl carrier protein of acetyl-CoA carboxylase n=1 Tax=Pelagicoccus mobilis TaxID=415221 RepID=A0A934RUL0_9BACT|nr:acetyl-CoA carboxylase biotin carboxyl carrier protein [Pelagicoccus mobilis]MBK1877930.1 acetyl-CoA carboxylase biotin carboxyl carrier protein [Pelagicoccus mobilis]